ncbi:MAG: JmjC domain-containing protein [Caldimonas sp.]
MDIASPTPLLGGLAPAEFMRRHWQKTPLLIPAAVPDARALVDRATLFELAARDEVESRVVVRDGTRWSLRSGPFARRALPALKQPAWTLLVQGADLHLDAAHRLLQRFRFVPDARLDDLMLSFATDGGGVGPHIDSYDVFLLQLHGRRRWKFGRAHAPRLRSDVPLRMLANFVPSEERLLEPGDMLYLPPGWAHDGVAEGPAVTASVGFRSAGSTSLGLDVLQHLLDAVEPPDEESRYADPRQAATDEPARIPAALQRYAEESVAHLLEDRGARDRALGETLSEPKPGVWFDTAAPLAAGAVLRLDRRTRMLYDDRHVYINGDSYRAAGRDATLVRRLADRRVLAPRDVAALSGEARELLGQWIAAGWLRGDDEARDKENRK